MMKLTVSILSVSLGLDKLKWAERQCCFFKLDETEGSAIQ